MVRTKKFIFNIFSFAAAVLIITWTFYPLLWILISSFKPVQAQNAYPPIWFNFKPTLDNYIHFFTESEFLRVAFNSIIVTGFSTILSLIIGTPTAYSLARFDHKHSTKILTFVLLSRMTPPIVMVLPLFMMARFLGITDTYLTLVLIGGLLSVPFVIWMMRGFFSDIPVALEEAAMVDGSTRRQAITRVILPLVAPGLAATAVLCSLLVWNEFLFILILGGKSTRTFPVLINMFVTEQSVEWGVMSAAAIITVLPLIVFGLAAQKYLVRGLTMGSIK
ncbi:MAG: carbohydrate ABC transporter permease [Halanaerobiaceae bacterium]